MEVAVKRHREAAVAAVELVPQTPPRSSPASLSSSLSSGLHGASSLHFAPRRWLRAYPHKPWLTSNMIWSRAPSTSRPIFMRPRQLVRFRRPCIPSNRRTSLISPPPNAFLYCSVSPLFPKKIQRSTVRCHEDSLHRDLPLERGHRGAGRAAQQPRGLGVRVLPA